MRGADMPLRSVDRVRSRLGRVRGFISPRHAHIREGERLSSRRRSLSRRQLPMYRVLSVGYEYVTLIQYSREETSNVFVKRVGSYLRSASG